MLFPLSFIFNAMYVLPKEKFNETSGSSALFKGSIGSVNASISNKSTYPTLKTKQKTNKINKQKQYKGKQHYMDSSAIILILEGGGGVGEELGGGGGERQKHV